MAYKITYETACLALVALEHIMSAFILELLDWVVDDMQRTVAIASIGWALRISGQRILTSVLSFLHIKIAGAPQTITEPNKEIARQALAARQRLVNPQRFPSAPTAPRDQIYQRASPRHLPPQVITEPDDQDAQRAPTPWQWRMDPERFPNASSAPRDQRGQRPPQYEPSMWTTARELVARVLPFRLS